MSENLLSPFEVELPISVLQQAQEFISACFELRQKKEYQDWVSEKALNLGLKDPGNKGIMMSYDFHLDNNDVLKLIEINTNASFLGLGYHMYLTRNKPLPVRGFQIQNLKDCILEELKLFGKSNPHPRIAIIDENPKEQRLYLEFLLYQELFRSFGFPTEIRDFKDTLKNPPPDFIYNRYTDFYFENSASKNLKETFISKSACLSPHPYEYFLLADKERLTDWDSGFLGSLSGFEKQAAMIQKHLLKSIPITAENKDGIWAERKKWFFKPTQDHGSRGSFKGGSISKKTFEDLILKRTIAQEYVSAPELTREMPEGPVKYKYDLRFYTYQDRMQLSLARLYQGQTTNLRTLGGGFACTIFNKSAKI